MTDRIKALTVVLRPDFREDDCEALIAAIGMLHGVADVTKHVSDINHHIATTQAKLELRRKIYEVLK